jgi:predicted metal-dependent HD superfamily phosphohydrolase
LNLKKQALEYNKAKQFILEKLEKELPKDLQYHNLAHVKDVYNTVLHYIQTYSIEGNEALMLRTAALFHDAGYIVQAKGHEEVSCAYARESLPVFGYSDVQVEAICEMIMATQIPQTPKSKLGEILADADLDYLGRDDFFSISNNLYLELKAAGIVTDEDQWNKLQVVFFENHNYFTDAAKTARDKKKAQNLLLIKAKL